MRVKLFFALIVLLLSVSIIAHSPSLMNASFDYKTKILKVTVKHPVKDIEEHYIEKITVELNGRLIIQQNFKSQTNKLRQEVSYTIIDAEIEDMIVIKAYCNISGRKSFTIIVSESDNDEE